MFEDKYDNVVPFPTQWSVQGSTDDAYVWHGDPFADETLPKRWLCAIMKVHPSSVAFWNMYASKYNEEVMYKLDRHNGKACLDVMVFTDRKVADVVLSAWKAYNEGQL